MRDFKRVNVASMNKRRSGYAPLAVLVFVSAAILVAIIIFQK